MLDQKDQHMSLYNHGSFAETTVSICMSTQQITRQSPSLLAWTIGTCNGERRKPCSLTIHTGRFCFCCSSNLAPPTSTTCCLPGNHPLGMAHISVQGCDFTRPNLQLLSCNKTLEHKRPSVRKTSMQPTTRAGHLEPDLQGKRYSRKWHLPQRCCTGWERCPKAWYQAFIHPSGRGTVSILGWVGWLAHPHTSGMQSFHCTLKNLTLRGAQCKVIYTHKHYLTNSATPHVTLMSSSPMSPPPTKNVLVNFYSWSKPKDWETIWWYIYFCILQF